MAGAYGTKREQKPHLIFAGAAVVFLIIVLAAVPAGPVPITPPGDSSADTAAGNLSAGDSPAGSPVPGSGQPQAMYAPAEPQSGTAGTGATSRYNRGYPIPVPILVVCGILSLMAGGLMVRRRQNRW